MVRWIEVPPGNRPRSRAVDLAAWLRYWILFFGTVYRSSSLEVQSILDVGCGKGRVLRGLKGIGPRFDKTYSVGVDIWLPYLSVAKHVYTDVVRCDTRKLPFCPQSFDLVVAADLLEHLERNEGSELLRNIEKISRIRVAVLTPVGYNIKNDLEDQNPWQAHQSGWNPVDFENRGYIVRGMNGARLFSGEKGEFKVSFLPLQPIVLVLSMWSHILASHFPQIAQEMLCIKHISRVTTPSAKPDPRGY